MNENQEKEYAERLKSGAKELIDGIGTESEFEQEIIKMIYGFVRRLSGIQIEERRCGIMEYKDFLIKLLDKLSENSIRRLYKLAEYLYIYKEGAE